jgi:hypothetical protein
MKYRRKAMVAAPAPPSAIFAIALPRTGQSVFIAKFFTQWLLTRYRRAACRAPRPGRIGPGLYRATAVFARRGA